MYRYITSILQHIRWILERISEVFSVFSSILFSRSSSINDQIPRKRTRVSSQTPSSPVQMLNRFNTSPPYFINANYTVGLKSPSLTTFCYHGPRESCACSRPEKVNIDKYISMSIVFTRFRSIYSLLRVTLRSKSDQIHMLVSTFT